MNIDETKFRTIISRLKTGNEETAKELEALLPPALSFQFIVGQKYTTRSKGPAEVVEVKSRGGLRVKVLNCGTVLNYNERGKCLGFKEYDLLSVYVPPKKRRVPLGPEDVPPLSALRDPRLRPNEWMLVTGVGQNYAHVSAARKSGEVRRYSYLELMNNEAEILRPNSTWQPAWKEIEE